MHLVPKFPHSSKKASKTVDGSEIRLAKLVAYPMIYKVLAPSQVVGLGISEASTVTPGLSCRASLIPSVKMRRHFVWLEWRATSFKYLDGRLGRMERMERSFGYRPTHQKRYYRNPTISTVVEVLFFLPKDSGIKESMGTGLLLTFVNQ